MKKLLTLMVALIPVLGFAQQNTPAQLQVRTAQTTNQKAVEKAPVAKAQPVAVVLTEEEQHAVWLKNNTQFKTMSATEIADYIQQLEQKISYNQNSPAAAGLQRELKWIKELQAAK
jgi:hypothetical protein